MADRNIARRYVTAFVELAEEAKKIDAYGSDLKKMNEAANAGDGILLRSLSNPVFTLEERRAALDAVLGKLKLDKLSQNFMRHLVERGRFGCLPDITEMYLAEADARSGRARVLVQTAEPLSSQLEAEVRVALEKATGKQVILDTEVDPSLIGGMVARVESRVYDASIRSRLEDIKQKLIHAQVAADA